jgi:hypothetical protein
MRLGGIEERRTKDRDVLDEKEQVPPAPVNALVDSLSKSRAARRNARQPFETL